MLYRESLFIKLYVNNVPGKNEKLEWKKYRFCGVVLLFMNTIMTRITGGAICFFILIIAIYMIIRANKNLKENKNGNEAE